MPRRKAMVTEDGQPVAAAALERPEGISDTVWEMAGVLGNVALARALDDVTSGIRPPTDARETSDLIAAARKLEARSYGRYIRIRDGMGAKLSAAKSENLGHVEMMATLRRLEDNPYSLVTSRAQNGQGGQPGTLNWEDVYGKSAAPSEAPATEPAATAPATV